MSRVVGLGLLARSARAVATAAFLATGHAMAADRPDRLIQGWYEADDACRGASAAVRSVACARRSILTAEIEAAGWCRGRANESVSGGRWSPCRRDEALPSSNSAPH